MTTALLTPTRRLATRREIQRLTNSLWIEHFREMGWTYADHVALDVDELYQTVLYPKFEFDLDTSYDLGYMGDEKVLGKVIMKEKVILIDSSIAPPNKHPQFPFTISHEFGHSVMHPDERELFRCTKPMIEEPKKYDDLEIEANIFAENLLMPDGWVHYRFQQCYDSQKPFIYIGKRDYWFTAYGVCKKYHVSSYTDFCTILGAPLCFHFSNASKTSMSLKMHRLRLVENHTGETWGPVFERTGSQLSQALKSVGVGIR